MLFIENTLTLKQTLQNTNRFDTEIEPKTSSIAVAYITTELPRQVFFEKDNSGSRYISCVLRDLTNIIQRKCPLRTTLYESRSLVS